MPRIEAPESIVGADILTLLTTGMYHTPLAVYREYIQNAADAIESSPWTDSGRVEVSINPAEKNLKIRDNGPGLTHVRAQEELIPIARSRKRRGTDRGFRGIGRLSGLAFADKVTFRTRASGVQPVTQISWDGAMLRANIVKGDDPAELIQTCTNVSKLDGTSWPDHFFEVEIEQVARHAAGQLLNRDDVRRYIAEVGPVPMSDDFPFTKQLNGLFADGHQPLTLEMTVNGDKEPIRRSYGAGLKFSKDRSDKFTEFQPLRIPTADSEKDAAVGWIAHSSYLGAIPKELGVRGIRLREGNIQIGGEDVLDPLFREERFNRWCVGELHIVDERLLPNGRRDYYEPSPHIRQVENHLESIIRGIVSRCRNASSARNQTRKVETTLKHIISAYELADSGYLMATDANTLIEQALESVTMLEGILTPTFPTHEETITDLAHLKAKLTKFHPRRGSFPMARVASSEVAIYQRVFGALTDLSPSPSAAKETIERVLGYASNTAQISSTP